MLLLKCPKCGQKMKYEALNNNNISKKRKKCVYCGHSFKVVDCIVKKV
jgi:Zn ribbon nucleic-acid-binding protein